MKVGEMTLTLASYSTQEIESLTLRKHSRSWSWLQELQGEPARGCEHEKAAPAAHLLRSGMDDGAMPSSPLPSAACKRPSPMAMT